MSELPTDPDALVRSFCDAWSHMDPDTLMSYFTDDAVYHNVPMDPAEGAPAIRAIIEGFATSAESIRFETLHQVATGSIVMNERIDTLVMGDRTVALPVAGVFVVVDGRITRWSDYFDLAQFTGA